VGCVCALEHALHALNRCTLAPTCEAHIHTSQFCAWAESVAPSNLLATFSKVHAPPVPLLANFKKSKKILQRPNSFDYRCVITYFRACLSKKPTSENGENRWFSIKTKSRTRILGVLILSSVFLVSRPEKRSRLRRSRVETPKIHETKSEHLKFWFSTWSRWLKLVLPLYRAIHCTPAIA
jgi:hypothetical protein